jgi:hypothetical protein
MNVRFGENFDRMERQDAMIANLCEGSVRRGPNVRRLKWHPTSHLDEFVDKKYTTKKLANTNRHTDRKSLSIDCDELYRQNSLLLYLSVNTDKNILSVYTDRIIVKKEGIKNDMSYIQAKLPTKRNRWWNPPINPSVIFKLWPNKWFPSSSSPFLLPLPLALQQTSKPLYFITNQPLTINLTTSTLNLSSSIF